MSVLEDGPETGPGHNIPVATVSELSASLKRVVEGEFSRVRVRGEISGFKRAGSGHLYMALKDDSAVLDAVCWRGTAGRLAVDPEDGLEVIATGKLTTYAGRSKYQIVIEALEATRRRSEAARGAPAQAGGRGTVRREPEKAAALPAGCHRRRDLTHGRRDPGHPSPP